MEAIRKGRAVIRLRKRLQRARVIASQEVSTPVIPLSPRESAEMRENSLQEVEAQGCDKSGPTTTYAEVYLKLLRAVGVIPYNCIQDERSKSTDCIRKVRTHLSVCPIIKSLTLCT